MISCVLLAQINIGCTCQRIHGRGRGWSIREHVQCAALETSLTRVTFNNGRSTCSRAAMDIFQVRARPRLRMVRQPNITSGLFACMHPHVKSASISIFSDVSFSQVLAMPAPLLHCSRTFFFAGISSRGFLFLQSGCNSICYIYYSPSKMLRISLIYRQKNNGTMVSAPAPGGTPRLVPRHSRHSPLNGSTACCLPVK